MKDRSSDKVIRQALLESGRWESGTIRVSVCPMDDVLVIDGFSQFSSTKGVSPGDFLDELWKIEREARDTGIDFDLASSLNKVGIRAQLLIDTGTGAYVVCARDFAPVCWNVHPELG